jgi:lysyl-tRNA synthetase class 1
MAANYTDIQAIMLKSLRSERKETYSIFMPVTENGDVLQVKVIKVDSSGYIVYENEHGQEIETSILDGNVKLQWKADWACRWATYGIDYEMYGKDLIPSAELSAQIVNVLGKKAPVGFFYELFLDENGQKISKTIGNGLSIETWLKYAPQETLAFYMYNNPQRAKKLMLASIPKATDEYLVSKNKMVSNSDDTVPTQENPCWYIESSHNSAVRDVTYSMLLNLASVSNAETSDTLWQYLSHYISTITPGRSLFFDSMVDGAVRYYVDQIKPTRKYRLPTEPERVALESLLNVFKGLNADNTEEEIQYHVYEIGKVHFGTANLKNWFKVLYETLLGTSHGPRMGVFVKLYGLTNTIDRITKVLNGEDLSINL